MPFPYTQISPSCSLKKLGFSTTQYQISTKKLNILQCCIIFVYSVQIFHFLHPLHTYRSTFVYVMRGGMELPAFSISVIQPCTEEFINMYFIMITQQECKKTKKF